MNLRRSPLEAELRVRVSRRQYEQLVLAADYRESSVSALVRQAVTNYLRRLEEEDREQASRTAARSAR